MGHSETIVILSVLLIAWTNGQSSNFSLNLTINQDDSSNPIPPDYVIETVEQANISDVRLSIPTTSQSDASSTKKLTIMNSVRIIDFIELNEEKHEAELILEFIQELPENFNKSMMISPRMMDIKPLIFRHVEIFDKGDDIDNDNMLSLSRRVRKVKVTVPCKMDPVLFPFDSSLCTILLHPGGGSNGIWGSSDSSNPSPDSQVRICHGAKEAHKFDIKGYNPVVLSGGNGTGGELVGMGVDVLSLRLLLKRNTWEQVFSEMYTPVISLLIISFVTMNRGSHFFRIGVSTVCLVGSMIVAGIAWESIPRENHVNTATEQYLEWTIGFIWEVVLTNIFMYRYQLKPKVKVDAKDDDNPEEEKGKINGSFDIEEDGGVKAVAENGQSVAANGNGAVSKNPRGKRPLWRKLWAGFSSFLGCLCRCGMRKKPHKLLPEEMHIPTMNGWHRFIYFHVLRDGYFHVPILFLLFNLVFFPIVISQSNGMPDGFMKVSESTSELEELCL